MKPITRKKFDALLMQAKNKLTKDKLNGWLILAYRKFVEIIPEEEYTVTKTIQELKYSLSDMSNSK